MWNKEERLERFKEEESKIWLEERLKMEEKLLGEVIESKKLKISKEIGKQLGKLKENKSVEEKEKSWREDEIGVKL